MSDNECIHGMPTSWCGICTKADTGVSVRTGEYGFHGGESKQDLAFMKIQATNGTRQLHIVEKTTPYIRIYGV